TDKFFHVSAFRYLLHNAHGSQALRCCETLVLGKVEKQKVASFEPTSLGAAQVYLPNGVARSSYFVHFRPRGVHQCRLGKQRQRLRKTYLRKKFQVVRTTYWYNKLRHERPVIKTRVALTSKG